MPPPQPARIAMDRSWHALGRSLKLPGYGLVHAVSLPRLNQGPPAAGPDHPQHVVLLHGFLQSSWTWRHNLAALQREFHVHALCLPGFGWSDKPRSASYRLAAQAERIQKALQLLGAEDCHLIGNSLGGSLALQIQLQAPVAKRRLVLVNPATAGRYPMAALASLQHEFLEPLMHLPGVHFGLGMGLRLGAYVDLAKSREFVDSFLAPLKTPGARRAALNVGRYFNRDLAALAQRLGDVAAPVLLLWGSGDRVVPLASVMRLQKRLMDARLEIYGSSGHCPMEEEPERFNREAVAFLTAHLAGLPSTHSPAEPRER